MSEEKNYKEIEKKVEAYFASPKDQTSLKKTLEMSTSISKKLDKASIVSPSKLDKPITL
jgi:hypothetical protein